MRYKMWLPSVVAMSISLASALMPKLHLAVDQDEPVGMLNGGDTSPYPAQTIDMPVCQVYPSSILRLIRTYR